MEAAKYKAAVDSVRFREDFEADTIRKMLEASNFNEMRIHKMQKRKTVRISIIAVALVAILALTAFALKTLLSPEAVAERTGNGALADAFKTPDAVSLNQSVKTGDFLITLQGIVSGKGLAEYNGNLQADRSYIVASVARSDGSAFTQVDESGISFSPLVAGYKPWQVNAWTLGGGYSAFVFDGVIYYVFDCANLEIFADRTVYLAAYEGFAPGAEIFQMDKGGEISYAAGYDKPHAMFTLPLDPSKADPVAAENLLRTSGVVIQ
jgi:hypothetical protein